MALSCNNDVNYKNSKKIEHLKESGFQLSSLLVVIGIFRNSPVCSCFFAVLFNVASIISMYLLIICTPREHFDFNFSVVSISTRTVELLLWWQMLLRRKRIFELTFSLTQEKSTKLNFRLGFFMVAYFLTTCNLAVFFIRQIDKTYFVKDSCRFFGLKPHNVFQKILIFIIDFLSLYPNCIVSFATTMLYCICCVIILHHNRTITEDISMKEFRRAWKKLQWLVPLIKKLENVMALPLFLAICKAALKCSSGIFLVSRNNKQKPVGFIMACMQYGLSFVFVVSLADLVQKRCMHSVDSIFFSVRKLKESGIALNYFDYLEMKQSCTLTAWNMLALNRKLLLTAFATSITYSLIITQITTH